MDTTKTQTNIPSGWKEVPIGKHIRLQGGNAFSAANYVQEGIPLVRIGNVGKGDFVANDFVYISEDEHASNESVHLRENDILMGMTGELGKVARIKKQHLPAILNQRVGRVVFKDKDLDPDFTFQVFLSKDFKSTLEKYFIGAAQKNISSSQVESVEVLLPPIKEQQKIAEILEMVDEDIAKTRDVIDAAEKLKRGLMQQLFAHGIGHAKFKETNIGEIPESWNVKTFEQFAVLQRGFDLPTQERTVGKYDLVTSNGVTDTHNQFKVRAPGVVTGRSGTLGNVFYIENDFWPLNTTLYIKDFHGNYEKFVYYKIQSFDVARFGTGTGVPTLNRNVVHKELVGVPDYSEQKKIADILSAVDEKISFNKKLKEKLTLLKKGLTEDLLSGKVRTI